MLTSRFTSIRILLAINILASIAFIPFISFSWLWVLAAMWNI
jgi:hypothetical protein